MNSYKLTDSELKRVYEYISVTDATEVLLKISADEFHFQSYNNYSTYLSNSRVAKDNFISYEYDNDIIIKFKHMPNLFKDLIGIITISIQQYYINFFTQDTGLRIDYIVPEPDEFIPKLNIEGASTSLQITNGINMGKQLSKVSDKVSNKIYLNKTDDHLKIEAYNIITNVKKYKQIELPADGTKFQLHLTYTPTLKLVLNSLSTQYMMTVFLQQNVIELKKETNGIYTQIIIMGECLTSELDN